MADNAEVKLGADVSGMTSQVAAGSRSVKDSLDNIAKSLDKLSQSSKKTSEDIQTNNKGIVAAFSAMQSQVKGAAEGVSASLEKLKGGIALVVAAVAGGALWGGAIKEMLAFEQSVRSLAITFGITAEAATQMSLALKLAGIESGDYERMAMHVGRQIRTQSDEFDRLKVVIRDAKGEFLPLDVILQNVYKRMLDFKAGTDQDLFAMTTAGRSAQQFASDMERLNAVTERAAQLQHELGIEMSEDRIAAIERYRVETNAFHVVLGNIADRIGEAVLPSLMGMAKYFTSIGPTATTVFVAAAKGVITVIDFLVTALRTVFVAIVALVGEIWDFAGIVEFGWSATFDKMTARARKAADDIVGIWGDAQKRQADLMTEGGASISAKRYGNEGRGNVPLPSKNERFTLKPTGGAGAAAESDIAALENELKAEENAYNKRMLLQGSFEVWSITQTRDYWEEVLSLQNLSDKDRLSAENKYYDAERQVQQRAFAAEIAGMETQRAALKHNLDAQVAVVESEYAKIAQRFGRESPEAAAAATRLVEIRQRLADERGKIAEIESDMEDRRGQHAVDMEQLATNQQVALRKISAQQALAQEKAFEDQRYAIASEGLFKRLALEADPTKRQEIYAKIEELDQAHQTKLTEIANKAELDRKQYALAASQALQDNFASVLEGLAKGTKKWTDVLKDGLKSLQADLTKLAAQQVAKMFLGPGTAGGSFFGNIFGKIFGGGATGESAAATALTGSATELSTAAAALQEAAFSMGAGGGAGGGGGGGGLFGGIFDAFKQGKSDAIGGGELPYYGPAAVGTPYVPQDSLAMVHKGEAIIPAKYNRGGASGIGSLHQQFVVNGPVDTRTQYQIAEAAARGARIAFMRVGG